MTINNQTQFTGESLGHLTGLDLSQNMYVGGVPVSINLPKPAVYPTKFTGMLNLWNLQVHKGYHICYLLLVHEDILNNRDLDCKKIVLFLI